MRPMGEPTPRNPSQKVRTIRNAHFQKWGTQEPAGHAEAISYEQARENVPIPWSLRTPEDARPWERKAYLGAREIYREAYVTGSSGLELRIAGKHLGKERRQHALRLLRSSACVVEAKERRAHANAPITVLRAVRHS